MCCRPSLVSTTPASGAMESEYPVGDWYAPQFSGRSIEMNPDECVARTKRDEGITSVTAAGDVATAGVLGGSSRPTCWVDVVATPVTRCCTLAKLPTGAVRVPERLLA